MKFRAVLISFRPPLIGLLMPDMVLMVPCFGHLFIKKVLISHKNRHLRHKKDHKNLLLIKNGINL